MTFIEYLDALSQRDFVSSVMSVPSGLTVAANALASLDEGLVDSEFVKQVFAWWHDLHVYRSRVLADKYVGSVPPPKAEVAEDALQALDALLLDSLPPDFLAGRESPAFLLRCKRKPRSLKACKGLIHAMPTHGLIFHLLTEKDRQRLAAARVLRVEPDPDLHRVRHTDAFELTKTCELHLRTDAFRGTARTLGRPSAVLWVTAAAELEQDVAAHDAADCVRDALGLIHIRSGKSLVALHLPEVNVGRVGTARPTFADAAAHRRFKVRLDLACNRRRAAWGYTADLRRVAAGEQIADGCRERVLEPIPTTYLGALRVVPLGSTRIERGVVCRGEGRDDDYAFALRLCAKHGGETAVKRRVLEMIGC